MGLFFEEPNDDEVISARLRPQIASVLAGETGKDAQELADAMAASIRTRRARPAQFLVARFVGSLVIFGILVAGGVAADVLGYASSSNALFGFAGAVFGIVTAFLGTEKRGSA